MANFTNENLKKEMRKMAHTIYDKSTDDGIITVTASDVDGNIIKEERFSQSDIDEMLYSRVRKDISKDESAKRAEKRKKFYNEFCRSYGESMLLGTISSIIAGLVVKGIKHIKK